MQADKNIQYGESSNNVEEAIRNGWSVMIKTINKDSYVPIFVFYTASKTKKLPICDFAGGEKIVS
ncbi:MAG: hypothetical protein WC974_08405 [Thermoplasmata archaeon]